MSKQYLPNMAESLKDPRVHVNVGDGVQYMKENIGNFDVIITDAPDPIGADVWEKILKIPKKEYRFGKISKALLSNLL